MAIYSNKAQSFRTDLDFMIWNEGILSFHNCPKSDAIALDSSFPSRYILGLSKQVLNFHYGPGAAELWVPKVYQFWTFEFSQVFSHAPLHKT